MCKANLAEIRYECLLKKFVYISDIRKCFQVGPAKAKEIFVSVQEQTKNDGFQLIDEKRVLFSRILKMFGITEKEIIDDFRKLNHMKGDGS